jgi:uncharacterized iron-regulated membrane protein
MDAGNRAAALYRTIWRWHFYAGLLVVPMIVLLSITGAIYLFKPQLDRWEERDFRGLPTAATVSPNRQLEAALEFAPNASFQAYRLPEAAGDAAMIRLGLPDRGGTLDVFVSPHGQVLGTLRPDERASETIKRLHGSLMLGRYGDWLVELAASWAIVMILSGLYLWWPRGRGLAEAVWPRLFGGKRVFWRDLHAVTGFWVAGLALILLLSGLPWASVWGSAFAAVRAELGLVAGQQDWSTSEPAGHAAHDHEAMSHAPHVAIPGQNLGPLSLYVAEAQARDLAFPALVLPPGAPQTFGPPTGPVWTVKSEAQNRPLVQTLSFDPVTGEELRHERFADKHPLDRAINYGIAWHEGQLFGWLNQLIGVLTAAMLVTLAVSGFVVWRRRKPSEDLGAPPSPPIGPKLRGVAVIVLLAAALLPLLAVSLVALLVLERMVLARVPALARWLGLRSSKLATAR